jgi:SAM-dependent methyltransferase
MGMTYGDFARVYDELMDEVPYEKWCGQIDKFIHKYGISRPRQVKAEYTEDTGKVPSRQKERAEDSAKVSSRQSDCAKDTAEVLASPADVLQNLESAARLASERDLVVDLGCGTGTFTRLLAERGYDVMGIDNSPEMLAIAADKTKEAGLDILYLLQDMRELDLYSTVGTVVSVCDSLNYILTEDDLLQVFQLVKNYLYPGGIFLFDFNTVYKYEQVIGDTVIAENREDCSFIWENVYDEDSCCNEYDLTVFVREQDGRYYRFQETHCQRGYTLEEMADLLGQAGLEVLETCDADTLLQPKEQSERVYIVARG